MAQLYNPNKERKILILFDAVTAGMISNKIVLQVVTDWFITGIKLNVASFLSHNLTLLYEKMLD